jgi:hypothetical protein
VIAASTKAIASSQLHSLGSLEAPCPGRGYADHVVMAMEVGDDRLPVPYVPPSTGE